MNYDVNYFLKKFEAIPESRWVSFLASDGYGRHCALGWTKNYGGVNRSRETLGLIEVFNAIEPVKEGLFSGDPKFGWTVANVNNGRHPDYQQPTPRQRILAALADIKAKQEGEAAVKEAEKIISQPLNIEVCSTQ